MYRKKGADKIAVGVTNSEITTIGYIGAMLGASSNPDIGKYKWHRLDLNHDQLSKRPKITII